MDNDKHVQLLQKVYASVLADAVLQFSKEGVLEEVARRKRQEQLETGPIKAAQFGISTPAEVFTTLSKIFHCANWKITVQETGFTAEATGCMLCALAKKMAASSPCHLYCLDPMEGMVKGLEPTAEFEVKETLWTEPQCTVEVNY